MTKTATEVREPPFKTKLDPLLRLKTPSQGSKIMAMRMRPDHVGFIPDGNRRWAATRGLPKERGYQSGIESGLILFDMCRSLGIPEISIYGFTKDNTKRPSAQTQAFRSACVDYAKEVAQRGADLLIVGDTSSTLFPDELRNFRRRRGSGTKVNLLVNYDWEWDLSGLREGSIRSEDVSRVDLIVRWGGGRRLSGFLPVQSVYADFYIVDEYWPDFKPQHFEQALDWFKEQDQSLGG
jgi:undecaprenyl diphosphate synthase